MNKSINAFASDVNGVDENNLRKSREKRKRDAVQNTSRSGSTSQKAEIDMSTCEEYTQGTAAAL